MRFRNRLALFLIATLAIVQALTALAVYGFTRRALIAEGKDQLAESATVFVRQLDNVSDQATEQVRILALDYALRTAIAERDQQTVLSALRNHGRRVGAARMMLVDLDGRVAADTGAAGARQGSFSYPDLIERAADDGAAAIASSHGAAFLMVAVPVLAPVPIAFIVAHMRLDDTLLARLRRLSTLPNAIELATGDGHGGWSVIATSSGHPPLAGHVPRADVGMPAEAGLVTVAGREFLMLAKPIDVIEGSAPVIALLGYPLDDALRPYRQVLLALAGLLAIGLGGGLLGTVLIARGVSRPVEMLAWQVRRIAAGDYSAAAPIRQRDEIGELSTAFSTMAHAVAEREERIQHQASHDPVTGLPNRHAIERLIAERCTLHPDEPGALLCLGLERLHEVIKTVGHELGDRLLGDAGRRLREALDGSPVGRVSDISFAVWLPGADEAAARHAARGLIDLFQVPYQQAELAIDAAAAIGIALYPTHGIAAAALLQHADVALYAALGSEDSIAVYNPAVDPHRPERLSLMSDLRDALEHGELYLAYQPKLDLAAGRIGGAEALVRWQHAKRGLVPPDLFIGLAEQTGNIRRLTRWAIASGVAQAGHWAAQGRALRLSVNLSVRDLGDVDLPRRIGDLMAAHGLRPEAIALEVTESAIMGEPDAAIAVLRRLADQGIDLAIDDFGVGQSSFAYLRRLPVRELKIDKAFILKLAQSPEDRTIVRSIVELGHRLGYRVTAEGVEDQDALAFLTEIGCDHAQGYFVARPMPADAFDRFLATTRWPTRDLEAAT
ncbi:MAG TPA: EAL domain-containing protein [Candidatus Sulfotelmatobacter sp.]|nr:EAL domain-containing protein [Candidatus Sulfotelmatobacter sp.]